MITRSSAASLVGIMWIVWSCCCYYINHRLQFDAVSDSHNESKSYRGIQPLRRQLAELVNGTSNNTPASEHTTNIHIENRSIYNNTTIITTTTTNDTRIRNDTAATTTTTHSDNATSIFTSQELLLNLPNVPPPSVVEKEEVIVKKEVCFIMPTTSLRRHEFTTHNEFHQFLKGNGLQRMDTLPDAACYLYNPFEFEKFPHHHLRKCISVLYLWICFICFTICHSCC
jgi:hypothetical protein